MLLCFQHHGLGDVMIIRKTEIHLSVVEKEKWEGQVSLRAKGGILVPGQARHGYAGHQAGVGMVG